MTTKVGAGRRGARPGRVVVRRRGEARLEEGQPAAEPGASARRRFLVPLLVQVEVDERVLRAVDAEWRERFYDLPSDRDVVAHLTYNLVRGASLSSLDGFGDQPDDRAEVVEVDCDEGGVEEVSPARRGGRRGDPAVRSTSARFPRPSSG